MSKAVAGGTDADPKLSALISSPTYRYYVLAVLFLGYIANVIDRGVLGVLLPGIKAEFQASDTELGLLGGIAFAFFYAFMGIPIAAVADRTNRRNVLGASIIMFSAMTALCGMASKFWLLLSARIGTAIGEAGGSPPSHSLIADYFPLKTRATALSIYALAVPIGTMIGNALGGWSNELYGWRTTFILAGVPGLAVSVLLFLTIKEPPRGFSDSAKSANNGSAPKIWEVFALLWQRRSFRHLSFAAALHAFVWYAGSTWNATFFVRSHGMGTGEAGSWLALFAGIGAIGTFFGGILADVLSTKKDDRRWYMWVPGLACVIMVPFQFLSYLSPNLFVVIPSFSVMVILAAVFFGPSFAMTQGLVTLRMRAVAASVLLFVQTLIGYGLGPLVTGFVSDTLAASQGVSSLRYALTLVGLINLWAAGHYFLGARTLRQDLEATEALTKAELAAAD